MNSIKLQDIIDFARAQAIADALHPTEESNWRGICRAYSRTYHTPLHLVYEMPPEEVALAFFENQMDDMDVDKELESLLDTIYAIEDPEYAAQKKAELDDFIEQAEEEERERLKKGKPIHPALRKENEVSLKNAPETLPEPDLPTGGSIDLSYLEDDENEK